jgi:hypothetical protein
MHTTLKCGIYKICTVGSLYFLSFQRTHSYQVTLLNSVQYKMNMFCFPNVEKKFKSLEGSEPFYRRVISSIFLWPNAFWPNHHLTEHRFTECRLTETPFDRIAVSLNTVWLKVHFTERSYDRFFFQKMVIWLNLPSSKMPFARKKNCAEGRLTENLFDRNFVWPKAFSENDHSTESSFDRKLF